MKIAKILFYIVIGLAVVFYIYYSSLSMKIYKQHVYYKNQQNRTADEFSKKIIVEKYPGSFAYFLILAKK